MSNTQQEVSIHDTIIVVAAMVLAIAAALAWNLANPNDFSVYNNEGSTYTSGIVTRVISEDLVVDEDTGQVAGSQELEVRIDDGPYAGRVEQIRNSVTPTQNVIAREGTWVTVRVDGTGGPNPLFMVFNYNRLPAVAIILAVFAALMMGVGRAKGLRSLAGLAFALALVTLFLLPSIFRGMSPVGASLLTALLVTAGSMAMLNGLTRKTLVSVLAAAIGLVASMAFYYLFTWLLHLSGFNTAGADELLVIQGNTGLDISQVLFASVVISSLGAVIDMCMSVASPLFELKRVNPGMGVRELFSSGMEMGSDMIGTMCQTLILAFVGSATGELLLQISYGTQPIQLISSNYMAVEVLQSFAGGAGVILVVPITSAIAAWVLARGAWASAGKASAPAKENN